MPNPSDLGLAAMPKLFDLTLVLLFLNSKSCVELTFYLGLVNKQDLNYLGAKPKAQNFFYNAKTYNFFYRKKHLNYSLNILNRNSSSKIIYKQQIITKI